MLLSGRTGGSVVRCRSSGPAQETELVLDLGRAQVNRQLTMDAFQMPRLGSKQVDLARDRPTGRGVVPARFR